MLGSAGGLLLAAQLAAAALPAKLEPVVVIGNPAQAPESALPYSVGVVDAETIKAAGPGVSVGEALSRVPGIAASSRNNYAQDLQLSSRGYGARAGFGVRGLRLYEDGIPATAPDGQGQVAHFDMANAERIEVLRGPFSALYGNASGGVIALFDLAPNRDDVRAGVDVGSFGLRQYRLGGDVLFGEQWNAGVTATRLDIEGFRPHSGMERELYSMRLGRDGTDRQEGDGALVLHANYWNQPAQDPLGLTRAQFDADPYQTTPQAQQFDTRKDAHQAQVGAGWTSGGLAISYYGGTRSVAQWLAIPITTQQASPNHSGGVVDFDRHYTGADVRYTWRWDSLDLTGGVAGDIQQEDRRGYENFTGPGPQCTSPGTQCGVTGAPRRDEDNRVDDLEQYLQAQWRFAQGWSSMLGVRHGQVHFRSQDHYLSNGDDSGERRFNYTTPMAGLTFEPAQGWSLRASAGTGYETPTFNELAYRFGGAGMNLALQAQSSRQVELGTQWRSQPATIDLALFGARTDDELVVLTNSGGRSTFGNAGRTARYGAELGSTWRIAPAWTSTTALSWLSATYREDFLTCGPPPCTTPTLRVPAGNRIPGVPAVGSFVDLAWQPAPFEVALEWRARSDVAVNDTNSDFAAGYGVLALRGSYELPLSWAKLSIGVRLDNLLDRAYAGSVIVNEANSRFFETGAPRSIGVSLRLEPSA